MGDGPRGIQVFPDYFVASTSGSGSLPSQTSSSTTDLRCLFLQNSNIENELMWLSIHCCYICNCFSLGLSHTRARRRLRSATSMLNLFSLRGRLSWRLGANGEEKVNIIVCHLLISWKCCFQFYGNSNIYNWQVVLSAAEVESLRSEIAALEERESHYKAQ